MRILISDLFDLTPREPTVLAIKLKMGPQDEWYVNRMIEEAVDTYKLAKRSIEPSLIDDRLEKLIDRIFERNLSRREYRYVVGLGLDARRVDMIERAIKAAVSILILLS
jgi:hypothetical protein